MNVLWAKIPSGLPQAGQALRMGGWQVLPSQNRLVQGNEAIALEPKVMDLLLCLASARGETVSREALLESVWPGVWVADDSLYRAISLLRRALAASPELAGAIVTVPRRGYRYAGPPVSAAGQDVAAAAGSSGPKREQGNDSLSRRVGRWLALGALAAAAAVLLLWTAEAGNPEVSGGQVRIRPLTSYSGQERSAAFSPDGRQVVFSWKGPSNSNWDLWIKRIGEDSPRRLTRSPAAEFGAAWSPDGTEIAFVSLRNGACRIQAASLAGEVRTLRPCWAGGDTDLAWSPDGRILYFSDRIGRTGPLAIHALATGTGAVAQISFPPTDSWGDHMPAAAPSGERIAFARSAAIGVTDVWTAAAGGGEARPVTDDRLKIHGIAWTPDSKALLFSSNRGGVFALWRAAASGGTPSPLLGSGIRADSVDLAPAGDRLVLEDERVVSELWEYDARSGTARRMSAASSWDWHPAFAPDGSRVAFVSDRSGSPELWVQEGDAGARQLTRFGGPYLQTPSWSPDGRRIAFAAAQGGNFDLFTVSPDGSSPPRRVTRHPAADQNPSWSRDGRSLYFGSRRTGPWEVWRIDFRSGNAAQITTSGGFRAMETAAGELVYSGRDEIGLFRLDLRNPAQSPQQILGGLLPIDWANWALAGTGIHYAVRDGNRVGLFRFAGRGSPQLVREFENFPYYSGLAVSPDGRRFVLARTEVVQSDLILVEGLQ